MKKIGIVTICDPYNYGNKLQNYASKKVYESLGYDVDTLTIKKQPNLYILMIKLLINSCSFQRLKGRARNLEWKRSIRPLLFARKYLNYTKYHSKDSEINKYCCISVGSDQVWNPDFWTNESKDFFLLNGVRANKISFAASFGVDNVERENTIINCLSDFSALSVREKSGAKIIRELTGREATVLVDPTMLLSVTEWRKISKKPKWAKTGYVLTYFLSPKSDDAKMKLEEMQGGRHIYELLNQNDEVAYGAGPSEFLWLVDNADIVFTDSFHACVFAFVFNKPFVVFDRNWDKSNMNSRIDTFLSMFDIKRKYYGSKLENDIWEHDYSKGYKQLELEKEKAIIFLKDALCNF